MDAGCSDGLVCDKGDAGMILITGGASQGKTAYIKKHYPKLDVLSLTQKQDMSGIADRLADPKIPVSCVTHLHRLIRYMLSQGMDVDSYIWKMADAHPDMIVTMDQVGSGIIPMEREERQYREAVGRAGCLLAQRSECVIWMVCGIANIIKG